MDRELKIMMIAGEASGDVHAAKLASALKEAAAGRSIYLFGAAGPRMRSAGVEAVVESDGLAIVGLAEIAAALPMFIRARRKLLASAIKAKPDVVVLIDFPDFNLKLAAPLKRLGIKVVYYISPQLWAWRKYRIRTVTKYVDLMLTILPFEKAWYEKSGFEKVAYVGSPLAREVHPKTSREEFRRHHGLDQHAPVVALLPGSRHKEITRILPVMLHAARLMIKKDPSLQFILALGQEKNRADAQVSLVQAKDIGGRVKVVVGETYDVLNATDAAAVTSGTATLEAGIIGVPMAIVYKTSAINYALLEPLISVEHYGLINLIAENRVATELIQGDLTAENLSSELDRLLDPAANLDMRAALREAADKLGRGGASKRAAEAILGLIG